MKQSPNKTQIEDKMKPSRFSKDGFLGDDTRTLVDIIHQDHLDVMQMGITHEMIANRMKYFTDIGKKNLGEWVDVEKIYQVKVDDYMGRIPCPFSDNFFATKTNTTFKNLELDEEVTWTELNIHMISEHGFYEGKGASFRIEPKYIAKVLNSYNTKDLVNK